MSCPDKKNTPSKDYISDTATCIATFVVKIYNLLNVPSFIMKGSSKRICYLLG